MSALDAARRVEKTPPETIDDSAHGTESSGETATKV